MASERAVRANSETTFFIKACNTIKVALIKIRMTINFVSAVELIFV
jgi:hypothetical protein